jgi:muramoyltetrapeptide carboxypeptidase LdcA involved in peptidoglycan recycling
MIKPPKLNPGDKVAAISLSWGGPATFPRRYFAGKQQLQDEFNLQVVETKHALADADWLWKNPQARANDLMEAFSDPSIKAIISTIGGDDSIRILPYLDLDIIRSNPKIFIGYSDSTVTHFTCFKVGLVSYYGPSVMAGFGENGGMFPYMIESVRHTLFSSSPIGVIEPNRDGWTVEMLNWAVLEHQSQKRRLNPSESWRFLQGSGTRRGFLIGGCFEVLDWLRGTSFWPQSGDWENAILFLETSEDAPSPDAVMYGLRTYAALGVLHKLSGILFARPGGQIPPEKFKEYDEAILRVVSGEEGLGDLPVVTNMDFGHTDPMFVIPYGIEAEIDCKEQQISILECAVSN